MSSLYNSQGSTPYLNSFMDGITNRNLFSVSPAQAESDGGPAAADSSTGGSGLSQFFSSPLDGLLRRSGLGLLADAIADQSSGDQTKTLQSRIGPNQTRYNQQMAQDAAAHANNAANYAAQAASRLDLMRPLTWNDVVSHSGLGITAASADTASPEDQARAQQWLTAQNGSRYKQLTGQDTTSYRDQNGLWNFGPANSF